MSETSRFTAKQLRECAEREHRMRERVYPRWVSRGTMTEAFARDQTEMMGEIVEILRARESSEEAQVDLFAEEDGNDL